MHGSGCAHSGEVAYSAAARSDLQAIAAFIADCSGSRVTAHRFTGQLRSKCRDLARATVVMGRPRPELWVDLRSFPFGSYVIFFRYMDVLEIVNILEAHRDIHVVFQEE